jgi:hypothetical protein
MLTEELINYLLGIILFRGIVLLVNELVRTETSIHFPYIHKAVPWLRRLAAGLPPRRPGFDPGSVHVGFVVDKVALGQVFSLSSSVFPCQFHSTGAPLLEKGQKIIIIIFIIGSHNKPHGCGASVASAAGTFINKKIYTKNVNHQQMHKDFFRQL